MWVKIQKGLVMEQHEVILKVAREQEAARLKALEEEEPARKKDARDLRAVQDRENNRFELMRTLPTFREFKDSMNNWKKGVMQDWKIEGGFPKKSDFLPPGVKAGSTVIRDDVGFEQKYAKKEKSELYIKKDTGEVFLAYRERIVNMMCDKAEQWLKDRKREILEAEKRKVVCSVYTLLISTLYLYMNHNFEAFLSI
jgi:hypothetical protein